MPSTIRTLSLPRLNVVRFSSASLSWSYTYLASCLCRCCDGQVSGRGQGRADKLIFCRSFSVSSLTSWGLFFGMKGCVTVRDIWCSTIKSDDKETCESPAESLTVGCNRQSDRDQSRLHNKQLFVEIPFNHFRGFLL